MTQLILAAHGNLAHAMLDTAFQMMGCREDIHALSLALNESPTEFENKLQNMLSSLNDQEIILLCDIAGGTPVNVIIKILKKYPDINIISGFNLSMVLAYMKNPVNENLSYHLIQAGHNGIIDINALAASCYPDNDPLPKVRI